MNDCGSESHVHVMQGHFFDFLFPPDISSTYIMVVFLRRSIHLTLMYTSPKSRKPGLVIWGFSKWNPGSLAAWQNTSEFKNKKRITSTFRFLARLPGYQNFISKNLYWDTKVMLNNGKRNVGDLKDNTDRNWYQFYSTKRSRKWNQDFDGRFPEPFCTDVDLSL